jgi:hypothetical protein
MEFIGMKKPTGSDGPGGLGVEVDNVGTAQHHKRDDAQGLHLCLVGFVFLLDAGGGNASFYHVFNAYLFCG